MVASPAAPAAAEGLKLKRLMMEDLRRADMPAAEQQWPSSASAMRPLPSPSLAHVPFLPPQTPRSSQPPSRTPRSRRTSAAAERPASLAQPLHTPRTRPQSAGPTGAASDVGYEPNRDPAPGRTRPVSASGLRPTIVARKAPTWGPGSPRRGGSRGQPAVAWATSGEVRKARCAAQLQRLEEQTESASQEVTTELTARARSCRCSKCTG